MTALAVQTFKGNIGPQANYLTASPNLSTTTRVRSTYATAISSGLRP